MILSCVAVGKAVHNPRVQGTSSRSAMYAFGCKDFVPNNGSDVPPSPHLAPLQLPTSPLPSLSEEFIVDDDDCLLVVR